MFAITCGYGFGYTCRLPLAVMKKPLLDEGVFTAEWLGLIGSGFSIGYALGKLVNGFLADYANVRRFFAAMVLMSALINLAMLGFVSPWAWAILWGLNGWFQGAGSPCSGVSLANWFSARERGRYYGIFSSSHSLGEGLTFVFNSLLVANLGWRAGFAGPGVFCILVAFGILLLLRDRPETMGLPPVADWRNDHPAPTPNTGAPSEVGRNQFQALRMPAMWVLGLSSACMYVSRYAINSWGMLYLQEHRNYTMVEAGLMLGLNTGAGLVGCVVYGFVSDKFFNARRPPVTLIFGLLEVIALAAIFFTPPGHPVVLSAAFLLFGFTLSGLLAVLGGLFAVDIVGRRAAGAAMGFIGIVSYLGNAMQEWVSGLLIQRGLTVETVTKLNEQGQAIATEVKHYDFDAAIAFWIGASVLSVVLAATLWRVKTKE
ncbi:MAG TPA: MFS transporter [Candidatus Paceibacterota bacterium]|nr:MFS transporter [Verrucomicrobiota bacterium]HSA09733.1 MFS transporter [Candidatus Paceibacterota bacterium]